VTTVVPPPPPPPPPAEPAMGATQPPPPLSPGGRTAIRVAFIVAAAVLVVGTVASLGGLAIGISSFRVINDSKTLPSTMQSLVVDTGSVPVAVRISTDREAREPRAVLRMVNSTRAGANPLMVTTSDTGEARITLSDESSPFLDWGRAGELKLVLPPDLARQLTVVTQQANGVVLLNADLDELIARTDNGEVVLNGAARRIEIHTENGDVVTRDPISVSESFSADTSNGDIEVELKDVAPRTLEATSQNGDVIVAVPERGPYVVNATTANGDRAIRVPQATDRENAAAVITVRSENGDVIVDDLR
jgi:hypothetical protein